MKRSSPPFQPIEALSQTSKWYEICPWLNDNKDKNLKKVQEKKHGGGFSLILGNILEEFIKYKILNRYFTPARLHSMGLIKDSLCVRQHVAQINTLYGNVEWLE